MVTVILPAASATTISDRASGTRWIVERCLVALLVSMFDLEYLVID